ncbi:hypothetical protein NPIL_318361, partial [Nephila pilipes]
MGLGPLVDVTCRNQIALPDSASASDLSRHSSALFISLTQRKMPSRRL